MKKGSTQSEEAKQKLRDNAKINLNYGMRGKHQSEEARQKLKDNALINPNFGMRGKHPLEETKQKMRDNAKINPNYGMRGKHQTAESNKKNRESNLGKISSFKGKHHTEEVKRELSLAHKGKHVSEDTKNKTKETKNSIEWQNTVGLRMREKMSKSQRGENNPNFGRTGNKSFLFGKHQTEEHKQKLRDKRKLRVMPMKDTKIEVKIQNYLKVLHIEFITHYYISEITHSYQCDILIPAQEGIIQKTIIECDGCFWHCCSVCNTKLLEWNKKRNEVDKLRTQELIESGYRVIRLWEHEIKIMQIEDLKEKLKI